MIKEQIETGKTVNEAIDAACGKLGCGRDEVQVEILELPKKGFFGFKTAPAKVRVYVEYTKAGCAVAYLKDVLGQMGFHSVEIDVKEEGNGAVLTLSGEDLGVVIGRRGETLDALQYLAGLVANKLGGDYFRITLDSGNYREKREKTLEALARKLALHSLKTGKSSMLEPMNPYERRIIHAAVQQIQGVTSSSVGDEPNRRIVISPVNPRRPGTGRAGGAPGRYGRDTRSGGYSRGPKPECRPEPEAEENPSGQAEQKEDRPDDRPLYTKVDL